MKCERCVAAGERSVLYPPTGSLVTAMMHYPFYDEDGVYHSHDGNTHSEEWACSKGHRWRHGYQGKCPAKNCAWNKTRYNKITWIDEDAP